MMSTHVSKLSCLLTATLLCPISLTRQESDLRSRESTLTAEIQPEANQMDDWKRWLQQFEQSLQAIK